MKASWSPLLALSLLLIGVLCSMGQSSRVQLAYYGSRDGAGADVTQTVQRFADYGEPFRVNNDTLSTDPSPNDGNTLVVVYHANGQRISDAVPEGEVFYFRSGRDTDYRPEYHKPGIRRGVPRLQGTLRRLTHRLRAYLLELAGACTFESATYEYIVLVNFAALRSSFHLVVPDLEHNRSDR